MSNLNAVNNAVRSIRHNNPKPIKDLIDKGELSDAELSICLNALEMHKELKELEERKDNLLMELGRKDSDIKFLRKSIRRVDPNIADEVDDLLA